MKHLARLALIGAALPLAGCMTSGTNMHNDFSCRAPNGTCAPMSAIDARAVAGLGAATQPVGGIVDPAIPREGRVVTASDGSPPGRTSDRVLRVVFPAHIDASGIYHDESTAHAVVEHGGWTDRLTGGARQSAGAETASVVPPVRADGSQTSRLATLDEVIAARAAQTAKTSVDTTTSAATFTPTTASPAMSATSPRLALMGSPNAIDLREVAAAASAQPVAGLDPNFDTPDVTAVLEAPPPVTSGCTGYRPVWWHGHAYRRLRPVPCPVKTAAVAPVSGTAVVPGSTRALNLAHAPATVYNAQRSSSAPAVPVGARSAQPSSAAGATAEKHDAAQGAAARVSALTAPGLAGIGGIPPGIAGNPVGDRASTTLVQLLASARSGAASAPVEGPHQ